MVSEDCGKAGPPTARGQRSCVWEVSERERELRSDSNTSHVGRYFWNQTLIDIIEISENGFLIA